MLLTLARCWLTLETGEIRSKDAAAAWAIDRLPGEFGAVLAHARAIYLGEAPERWEPPLSDAIVPTADALVENFRILRPGDWEPGWPMGWLPR